MKLHRLLLASGLLLAACGGTDVTTIVTEPPAGPDGTDTDPTDPVDPVDPENPQVPQGMVVDLRADTNRDGVIKFDDPADDKSEDVWDAKQGAVFLANIDDDESSCTFSGVSDVDLPKCHDAADDVVNGDDDEKDLARIKTKPWADAPAGAGGTISWTAPDRVRLFKVANGKFTVASSGAKLTEAEIKSGVELAIEGKDIVRDTAVWDGYVTVTLNVTGGGKSGSDTVKMRVAPLLTYHHVLAAEQTWVSDTGNAGNLAMRNDVNAANAAAGVPALRTIQTGDSWNQDYFETGFMSMPGPNGTQHAIRVNIRSANIQSTNVSNPLRPAGRAVFALRGKDSAAVQEYDKTRPRTFDTLNSFGNFETVPPYTHNGQSYPLGRQLRGNIPSYYTDKVFTKMMEAQKVQPPIYLDTSWLVVGHVDETLSFVKANNARGWVLLVNDATMAVTMLQQAANSGFGNVPMFVGKFWGQNDPAQATINQVLSDEDVMTSSAEAQVEVAAQITKLKTETGLTDAEIIKIPFLHMSMSGRHIAYQPGMVNGIYVSPTMFVAPDPHGPLINGQDIFKVAMQNALTPFGVTVRFAEDWDTYHRNLGEVHCGTNTTRAIPTAKWWESGR
jgi:protein-arginine deiminase